MQIEVYLRGTKVCKKLSIYLVPLRYYKELFDESRVPGLAVLAYLPCYPWLGPLAWVLFGISANSFVLCLFLSL